MNILQSAFWLLYLLLCSLLLQGRTCTLADFFGHIFISIVLLFVRMPSLAFSSATCQEEWGVVLAIWTRSNLITPSALTQATNLVTFKTKINTTGFRNIWNTFVDHWSLIRFLRYPLWMFSWEGMGLHDVSLLENLFENCGNTLRSKMKESWVGPLGVFGPQPQIIFLLERDWIFFTILPSSAPLNFFKLSN